MNIKQLIFKTFTVGIIAIFSILPTYAFDKQKAIDKIKEEKEKAIKLSDKLWDYSRKANEDFLGSALNEIGVEESSCYILGSVLNKKKYVKKLKPDLSEPNFKNKRSQDTSFSFDALLLDNFRVNVERILDLTDGEQIEEWNLDCIGKFEIPRSAFITQTGASSFYIIKNEGKVLRVLGNVEEGFSEKIKEAIIDNPEVEIIALGSSGGSVKEAILAGYFIREKKLETTLWNNCYSACPLVFIGGVKRTIWSPYPEVGFHQIYTPNGKAVDKYDDIYRLVYLYLKDMGIYDPLAILKHMWAASPKEINIIDDLDALCEVNNIATWIQRACWHDRDN